MTDTPSAKYGIPRPADNDFINTFPATSRAGIDWVDQNISTFITTDPRPAAGKSGRWHLNLASGVVSLDSGSSWVEIARVATTAEPPLGIQVAYTGVTLPTDGRWAWADGGLLLQSAYPEYYALVGHAYNGGVDPGGGQFRKPDKRGRVSVGADQMPGGSAAGRLPNSSRAFGQNGGEERHLLAATESGVPVHGHALAGAVASGGSHNHYSVSQARNVPTTNYGWDQQGFGSGGYRGPATNGSADVSADSVTSTGGAHTHTDTFAVSNNTAAAAAAAHNILQPYEVDTYIVKVK